jgi:hypothetical protein
VSGTPTVAGAYQFTVIAVDSTTPQEIASATLSIAVISTTGDLAISTSNLPQGTVGTAYSAQLSATGGTTPYAWSVASGTVPAGLTLSSAGVLSGTPTTSGSFAFTLQVADSSSTTQLAQATFSVTINANPSVAVAITTGSLPAGSVGISYHGQLQAAGGTAPYSWSVIAGLLPEGLTLGSDGTISGTPTAAGSFDFTVEVADSDTPAQTATRQFTITVAPAPGQALSITTATLPNGSVGISYDATISASGGTTPYAFTVASGTLPPGLLLAADGSLTGVPTTAGSFSFTVRVTDSASQTAERSYTLTIVAGAGQMIITTANLPPGRTSVAYSATFTAVGGTSPYHWSVTSGSLPPGLTLSDDGMLSGTPSAAGTFTFTVMAIDSSTVPASASRQYSLTIR